MSQKQNFKELRLILGDQLNAEHSWYNERSQDVLYVLMEIKPESKYVKHHLQKILAIFHAMRKFRDWLKESGHQVKYYSITSEDNRHGFGSNCEALIKKYGIQKVSYQEPDEYRLDQILAHDLNALSAEVETVSSEHFLTDRTELSDFFVGKKQYLMETFYRSMRKKYNILMLNDQPEGGDWNYDQENRKKLPKKHVVASPIVFNHDVTEILNEVKGAGLEFIGKCNSSAFIWPKDRKESVQILDYFLEYLLPFFGTFQDAMSNDEWSIYHSRLSFSLNTKILSPLEVIKKVEAYWRSNKDLVTLAQAEGFIRQILGWREYMRGIYWAKMPEYAEKNALNAERKLPDFFWTGDTKMNCLHKAITQSLDYSYAHHIQRLMVTGNFCTLAGIHPDEVDEWYLGIYIDAFEWVEITNTRGMSQFADGGIVGTKPYVSSASYIDKMGDHCSSCYYSKKEKTGEKACPFNSLYWHFLARHQEDFKRNPRMSMMYAVWNKMDDKKQNDLLAQANKYLDAIEQL